MKMPSKSQVFRVLGVVFRNFGLSIASFMYAFIVALAALIFVGVSNAANIIVSWLLGGGSDVFWGIATVIILLAVGGTTVVVIGFIVIAIIRKVLFGLGEAFLAYSEWYFSDDNILWRSLSVFTAAFSVHVLCGVYANDPNMAAMPKTVALILVIVCWIAAFVILGIGVRKIYQENKFEIYYAIDAECRRIKRIMRDRKITPEQIVTCMNCGNNNVVIEYGMKTKCEYCGNVITRSKNA